VLRNIQFTRAVVKKSVMTIPYNISLTGVGDQLMEFCSKTWNLKEYLITIPAELTKNNEVLHLSSKEFDQIW
jgi:Tfp pilus assembly protein PilO